VGGRSLLCTADVCYTCQPPRVAVVHNTTCNTLVLVGTGKPNAVVGTGKPNAERCGQHQHAQPRLVLHAVSPPLLHYQPHRCHHFTTITLITPPPMSRRAASPSRLCPPLPHYHHNHHQCCHSTILTPTPTYSRFPVCWLSLPPPAC
jgi:hypothetical protein